ncbi:PREDICTED: uncharacterized protein LOC109353679 isoform X2 [Lupinus angustifolius]|uniref:uncharacterized protein LOC109353679 isoform X2 n=1 Tax=Lupinus angustifolius TaxID=3871 RepID=UPI00092E9774|nr:PREDICTED: uncharacterized protein LOC109353679 isoform X2 [Lupinus angustifolius]
MSPFFLLHKTTHTKNFNPLLQISIFLTNSLSQLYTHAMKSVATSLDEEKLYQWIMRQKEEGSKVAAVDVLNYIQNELDYCGEEPSMSPRAPLQQQQSQPVMHVPTSGFLVTFGSSGQPIAGQGLCSEHCDNQPKNSVFSNALSSPVRRSLQQAGSYSSGLGNRNTEPGFLQQQSRDSVTFSSNDSAMDTLAN